jgi:aldehyde:ferredoxin oxidoreductase
MANGFTGNILRVNLTTSQIDKLQPDEDFYRTYLGGSAIGTWFLLRETPADLDPLDERNIVTIAPSVTTGAPVSGASRCCIVALSPETNAVGDTQAGGLIGPMVKRAGYDALVITGKAPQPSYLLVDDDDVRICPAAELTGRPVLEVHETLTAQLGPKKRSILQCGPAGEKLVRYACLMADLNNVAGRTGMGAVFGSKNLRAVVVQSDRQPNFADAQGLKELAKVATQKLPDAGFPSTLKQYGTPGVLGFQTEAGNLATRNYSRSYHEQYKNLDGATFEPEIGSRSTTCYACIIGCRKTVKTEKPYEVTDKLGGPEFETLGLLGANLDITDVVAVAKANELCNNYGIDTIALGGLAGYLFECAEKNLITPEAMDGRKLGFGDAEGLLWLIEKINSRDGVGDILADGFAACIKHFGEETRPFAICVKNHGFAVHMAQVKPSQALMYAACPIGADHMSAEHDWLIASAGEDCKGLGIMGKEEPASTNLNKVRATVYAQYYYSLLDTLCLCMFVWGPGNLYNYRQLEDLLRYSTGWDCSFWELMKAGERRVNMMRQLNARRGFTRADDKLPARIFEPLPDGPAKGRCMKTDEFEQMLDQYYDLMGWDRATGNPTSGKLAELGLEWTI